MSESSANQVTGQRGKLAKGAAWVGGARIFNGLLSLLSTVLLARLLSPDDFGIFAIAWSVAIIIATLGELALRQALIHVEDLEDGHFDTAFTLSLIRAVILAALVSASAWPIAAFYGDPRLVEVMLIFAIVVALTGLTSPRFVLLQRALDFRGEVALSIADKVAALIVAVAIAYYTGSYFALPFGVLAAQLAKLPISYIITPYRPHLTLSHHRDLLSFSIWITLGTWVKTLNQRAEPLLLGYFVSTQRLGQFSIADRLSGMVSREMLIPIASLLFPAFSRIRSDPNRLRHAYLEAQGVLISVVLPVTIGLALLAEPTVRLVLSEKWLPAIPYIQILSIAYAAEMLQSILPIAMATGHTKALFKRDVRSLAIRIPFLVGGIYAAMASRTDLIAGALIGGAIGTFINSLLNMRLIARFSTITIADHLRVALRPVLAAIVMSLAVTLVAGVLPPYSTLLETAVTIAILAGVGAAVYFASLAAMWLGMGKPRGAETHAIEILVERVPGFKRFAA